MFLEQVIQRVSGYQPTPLDSTRRFREAAVLIPITRSTTPELILTQRAHGLSTHGGEVAFPGGRRDSTDRDLIFTALRETHEEVGLEPDLVEVTGALSPLVSLHGVKVSPYVGVVPEQVCYRANAGEIASIFSVPLEFFASDPRQVTHRIDYLGRSFYVPSYTWNEYKIWGLTAAMVVELVNIAFDLQICLHQPPQLSKKEL